MDEGSINVKALRAKFQEEASQAQSKTSRPAVAEKPKHLPPSGGHCCPVAGAINTGADNRTPAVSRVVFRDGLGACGGRRPISFPPKIPPTPPSFRHGSSDATTRQSLSERHMPLVLPFIPVKEHKSELPATRELKLEEEPGKEAVTHTKIKKKGLLLPFKSSKAAKISGENGEPTYSDLAIRPSSAPGELPSAEKPPVEDRLSFQSNQSTSEFDISVSPPPTGTSVEPDNKIVSTLEKARKKLSCRQMLLSAKSLRSPDYVSKDKTFPSPPTTTGSAETELPIPSPVCLPNLSCLSARPFFKANISAQKSALDKAFGKHKAEILPVRLGLPSSGPPKKPLPTLRSLGPQPPKPARPPVVDLGYFHPRTFNGREPEAPSTSVVLDAPEFPDFDQSEIETAEGEAVDIGALDLEAANLACTRTPPPDLCELADFADSLPLCGLLEPLLSGDADGSHLESASLPDPVNISEFPVSELWSQSEDVSCDPQLNPHPDDAEKGAADDWSDARPSGAHRHSYAEAGDNVYEDVEGVKKLLLEQNLHKRKAGLKNPYADSQSTDGAGLHTWPRHPRKERQSPHTADYKEQKKREKQRLEKEKKEQREREKRENEMKKKFKVTGEEEPMYHARVTVASKVRKNDLPVKNGDTVSIIRTTSCPKGKWLARDASNRYGYISVMNVELNIKEMLELGKKAQAAGRGGTAEGDTISIGSRSSNHPVLTSSFTDDSEEWACEDETLSFCNESHGFPPRSSSTAETSCGPVGAPQALSDASLEDQPAQTRHQALQKLAIFFQHSKDECADVPVGGGATPTNAGTADFLSSVEEPPFPDQEADFTEVELLPPPALYADTF